VLGCRAKAAVLVAAFLVLAVEGYCSSATATTTTARKPPPAPLPALLLAARRPSRSRCWEGLCRRERCWRRRLPSKPLRRGRRWRSSWPTQSPSAPGYSRGGPPVAIRMVRLARGTHAVKRPCVEPEVRYGPRSQEIAGALPPTSGPAADPLGVARGHGPTQGGNLPGQPFILRTDPPLVAFVRVLAQG